jgi:putative phage-type endonuclease
MSARAMWLESRRRGIGGSDAAAILGLDPWRSGLDVWVSKLKPAPQVTEEDKFLLRLGKLLEPVIAGLYTAGTDREIYIPEPEIIEHLVYPELIGTPDRLCPKDDRVIELKSEHQFADKFGDPGTDQVPDHYLIQCAHYMAVADLGRCDVAVLHGGAKFAIYQLRRDLEMERYMIEQLRQWWADYIIPEVEPPLDASEAWGNYLATKYPYNRGPMLELAPGELAENPELVRNLSNVFTFSELSRDVKTKLAEATNYVKRFIGEHDGIRGPFGQITWRMCKDSTARVCNYEKLFRHVAREFKMTDELQNSLIDQFLETIVTKAGSRRFVPKRAKDIDQAVPETDEAQARLALE